MSSDTSERFLIPMLALSAAGLVAILGLEGYTDKAVIPVPGDVPTIGFGSTQGVKIGDKTTPPQALKRALRDASKFEGAIKKCVKVPLHQYEYDAFVSVAYNVGEGAFCGSRLVAKLNTYDYAAACAEITRWRFYQGKDCSLPANKRICGGIWARRQGEAARCRGELVE